MNERVNGHTLNGVRRIGVLRAGGLGDLLFTLPAIEALAACYPAAEIVLFGNAGAAKLLGARPGAPHRVVELPQIPGVGADENTARDEAAIEAFVEARRAERYDLIAQMHGGGRYSNPFVNRLGARVTVGTRTEDAASLDRALGYVYYQHEVMRWLEVASLVGATPVAIEPRLAPLPQELARARGHLQRPDGGDGTQPGGTVAVHPGATDPRRRWPVEHFAQLVSELERDGARAVLVGHGADDEALCARIAQRAGVLGASKVLNLAGALSLGDLAGVLATVDVMVGNDSGPRHLAQAVGTRTASIFWCGNLLNAGPFTRGKHRVQISWTTRCPECGVDCTQVGWTAERCPHEPSFVADVGVPAVLADVRSLLLDALAAAR